MSNNLSLQYTTKDGDMLDAICYRHYGASSGYMEQVLAANPGLAELGPVYSAGEVILLPSIVVSSSTKTTTKLYD